METLLLTGSSLTLDDVVAVARHKSKWVAVSSEQLERVVSACRFVDMLVQNRKIAYGVNTGFGSLKNIVISPEYTAQLQANLIRSHSVGVGDPYDEEIVRAAILIRINSLIHGNSGIRPETITALLALLNNDIYPFIPSKGSVGASGDLSPLSHIALAVKDIDGEYERLRKEAVVFMSNPVLSPDGYAKVAFCRAPEGTFVELVEVIQ